LRVILSLTCHLLVSFQTIYEGVTMETMGGEA